MAAEKIKKKPSSKVWDISIITLVSLNVLLYLFTIAVFVYMFNSGLLEGAGALLVLVILFGVLRQVWVPLCIITLIAVPMYLYQKRQTAKMKWVSVLGMVLSVVFLGLWLREWFM